jgi:ketosteroid isomerase-like protein
MASISTESIQKMFGVAEKEGYGLGFLDYIADNAVWIVTGSDNPLRGTYTPKTEILRMFGEHSQYFEGELKPKLTNVLVIGDTAVVELTSSGITKKGVPVANEHCWILEFEEGKIVQLRGYMDTALTKRIREEASQ